MAKILESAKTPLEYTKQQFLRFYSQREANRNNPVINYLLDETLVGSNTNDKVWEVLEKRFHYLLITWTAETYPQTPVHELLGMSEATYYNWLNGADKTPPSLD